ncbi:glycosyltransferase family 2 protein [Catenuloplanes indicus]|uniref:Glycosyltransferase involved in cell wall biosynthesis n=1 Tax=Catenuloplanes indicus TaxID=137267 RepID=A0AAE3W0C9_9ACTN|nr:glycosyltransferase [Catenuloplanes indicus]MDQ0367313.1 glycosyltransferase involved in cell wall biosynthesis [Catenuloplanes indicus]
MALLSVVVPVYNVAPYLAECLESIAAQTYRDLDVVLVDDGSTDDSARIAAGFAARDERFRLVSQPNAGLGAARNTGVRAARGELLQFVDSDDVLPPDAARTLAAAIACTGSDFATGNTLRLDSRGLRPSRMHARIFTHTRLRTHVTRDPELLGDRTAWNKVFRRAFWDRHGFAFPEGVLYEDTPVMVPAHVLARSVDVVHTPVYHWRRREGGDRSITQRREETRNFVDRFDGVDGVSRFLGEGGWADLRRWYDASAVRSDLAFYLRVLPEAPDEYIHVFLDRCNEFLDRVPPRVLDRLPAATRVQWHLVRQRRVPELLEVIRASRDGGVPVVRRGLRRYRALPYLDAGLPYLPRRLYRAGPSRLRRTFTAINHKIKFLDSCR